MTADRTPPQRHWRSYGTEPLPSGPEALDEPFRAFPSWFMRITCDRCGKDRMLNEAHTKQGGRTPITETWDGVGTPLDFVVSKNLHRRHLNLSQRAMIACQIANMPEGRPWPESNRIQISGCNVTAEQAAKMLGVSRALVIRAKTIWHLNLSQRAMIACQIATMKSGERTDLGYKYPRLDDVPPISAEQAAKQGQWTGPPNQ